MKNQKQILKYWILEKKSLALKKRQFVIQGLSSSQISRVLRKMRERKEVIYFRRRWVISPVYRPDLISIMLGENNG